MEDEVRAMFLDDPSLSVDTIARALATKYRQHGLVKGQISRIRLEVRLAIEKATVPTAPPALKRRLEALSKVPPPFNQIHWGIKEQKAKSSDAPKSELEPQEAEPTMPHNGKKWESQRETHQRRAFPESTHQERVAFLEEFVLQHPQSTISRVRQSLKERFGQAVGTKTISDALQMVREYAKPAQTSLDFHAKTSAISDIVKAMREIGLKQIKLNDDGKWEANG